VKKIIVRLASYCSFLTDIYSAVNSCAECRPVWCQWNSMCFCRRRHQTVGNWFMNDHCDLLTHLLIFNKCIAEVNFVRSVVTHTKHLPTHWAATLALCQRWVTFSCHFRIWGRGAMSLIKVMACRKYDYFMHTSWKCGAWECVCFKYKKYKLFQYCLTKTAGIT